MSSQKHIYELRILPFVARSPFTTSLKRCIIYELNPVIRKEIRTNLQNAEIGRQQIQTSLCKPSLGITNSSKNWRNKTFGNLCQKTARNWTVSYTASFRRNVVTLPQSAERCTITSKTLSRRGS